MQSLVNGIHHFRQNVFPSKSDLFLRLAQEQRPVALMITCSDSRINPNLITDTEPGELFIVRNVGNMVPPHGAGDNGEAAAIEYSVVNLNVNDIIVCGHTHCGAMHGLLNPKSLRELPAVRRWLRHGQGAAQIVREQCRHLEGAALLTAAAQQNVLVQLRHLETLPVVAARLARGDLQLHGWIYKIETGDVLHYDRRENRFVMIEHSFHTSHESRSLVFDEECRTA
jgi:carbonic anhydrase